MQSQQKKLKWSRGETSEALEERTDTGITNVSVERLENCVCDIYGNVSRRPAFKFCDTRGINIGNIGGLLDTYLYSFVFTISTNDYCVCIANPLTSQIVYWRITNGEVGSSQSIDLSNITAPNGTPIVAPLVIQYNNYAICFNIKGPCFKISWAGNNFNAEPFEYQGPWYAPNGTQTRIVTNTTLPGLEFNKDELGFVQYTYEDSVTGQADVYYTMDTGLPASSIEQITTQMPVGSIIEFPQMGAFMRIEGYHYNGQANTRAASSTVTLQTERVYMFGELLTPVANGTKKDTTAKIEYGYIAINSANGYMPTTGIFMNQRLYLANFAKYAYDGSAHKWNLTPGLVVGSQIGRYTDFKNNYNLSNEPITIDIAGYYQEYVQHLLCYNGLKIFTDAHEYTYGNDGVQPQSANGSSPICHPLIFNNLVLYMDSNLRSVRGLQYEFQQDIFASNTINEMAPKDLVFNPVSFTKWYEKGESVGNFLYLIQRKHSYIPLKSESYNCPSIAVCNFTPGNQNIIWGRWDTPEYLYANKYYSPIMGAVETPDKIYFIVVCAAVSSSGTPYSLYARLAELDYSGKADLLVTPTNGKYQIGSETTDTCTFPMADVSVYANGIWQWDDTLDAQGNLSKPTTGLQNVQVGFKINSYIKSHPVDVGGKTKSVVKRIAKAIMSVRETEPGAISINGKTGYMNPAKDMINFYGITGMKREIKYTITNINGAMFHLESLLLNIEYGTLIS